MGFSRLKVKTKIDAVLLLISTSIMQGCQPIFRISPGSQMLQQHGPPKKRNQTGGWIPVDGSRWMAGTSNNGTSGTSYRRNMLHIISKIQGSLRTLNRLSDYPCIYIYIYIWTLS